MCRLLSSFAREESGTIAVLFGVSLVPIVLAAGIAVDFSRAIAAKDKLQNAADIAALAMVQNFESVASIEALAQAHYEANAPSDLVSKVTFKAEEIKQQGVRVARVTYDADVRNYMVAIVGIDTTNVAGVSEAEVSLKKQFDIHTIVDTSDSMGLASSEVERKKLEKITTDAFKAGDVLKSHSNCAFACHKNQGSKVTTLKLARDNGVDLRIDVAKRGVQRIIELADEASSKNTEVRMSLTAFNTLLFPIVPMESSLNAVSVQVDHLELGYKRTAAQDANSWFDKITGSFAEQVSDHIAKENKKAQQKGPRTKAPQQVVLLVTDGLNSQNCAACAGKDKVFPFRKADCDTIKATGAQLAVVYTKYHEMPTDWTYLNHAAHAVPLIEPALRQCASPGLFAMGNTPAEIDTAFKTIFDNLKIPTHLTK